MPASPKPSVDITTKNKLRLDEGREGGNGMHADNLLQSIFKVQCTLFTVNILYTPNRL